MKVLLLGSSQTKHIEKVFTHCGHRVIALRKMKSAFLDKIEFLLKFLACNMLYHVGGLDVDSAFFFRMAGFFGKKVVVHWIGTDVLNYTKKYEEHRRAINKNCINLAGSELLQKELEQIGIQSYVVPIVPTDFCFAATEVPEKHAVLSYIPESREDFYNMPLVKEMAKQFPEVDFHIVANAGEHDTECLPNVKYQGRLNAEQMYQLYEKCSILFRFPEHDGLSMMLLEALGYGKNVVYCYDFPYAETPKTRNREDVLQVFEKILSKPPVVNQAAVDFINSEFSMDKQIERYIHAGVLK